MHSDPGHSAKVSDVASLCGALQSFEGAMQRTMLAMKELRDALEEVGRSSFALSSLSFCDKGLRAMTQHVAKELKVLNDGDSFLQYNMHVHREALAPVKELRVPLKAAKKQAHACDSAKKRYEQMRTTVEKKERKYAKQQKSLAESKTYSKRVGGRDKFCSNYEKHQQDFNKSFEVLLQRVSTVTDTSVRRYILLNTTYLVSVVNALEKAASFAQYGEPQPRVCADATSCTPCMAERLRAISSPAVGVMLNYGAEEPWTRGTLSAPPERSSWANDNPVFFKPHQGCSEPRYHDASQCAPFQSAVDMRCSIGDRHHFATGLSSESPVPHDCVASHGAIGNAVGKRPSLYDMDHLRAEQAAKGVSANSPTPLVWRTQDLYSSMPMTDAGEVRHV